MSAIRHSSISDNLTLITENLMTLKVADTHDQMTVLEVADS